MSEPTKKLPTKEIKIQISKNKSKLFLVPKEKADGILKILSEYEVDEATNWRESVSTVISKTSESATVLRGNRHKLNLTQVKLADMLDTTQSNIAALENGTRTIGKSLAKKLAKIFKTDYRVFL